MPADLYEDHRQKFLSAIYKIMPFNLAGGWHDPCDQVKPNFISCLIIASQRVEEIDLLLDAFGKQSVSK